MKIDEEYELHDLTKTETGCVFSRISFGTNEELKREEFQEVLGGFSLLPEAFSRIEPFRHWGLNE